MTTTTEVIDSIKIRKGTFRSPSRTVEICLNGDLSTHSGFEMGIRRNISLADWGFLLIEGRVREVREVG